MQAYIYVYIYTYKIQYIGQCISEPNDPYNSQNWYIFLSSDRGWLENYNKCDCCKFDASCKTRRKQTLCDRKFMSVSNARGLKALLAKGYALYSDIYCWYRYH